MIHEYIWGTEDWLYQDNGILIKRIVARDKLSVQVHPVEKTESWYIEAAEDDAFICLGCSLDDPLEIKAASEDGTIEQYLTRIPVHRGEFYFIPWGTVHAIGSGCTIVEVQQDCNITYRLYDYKRVGADGRERELHLDRAIEVIRRAPDAGSKILPFACDYFSLEIIVKDGDNYLRVNQGLVDIKLEYDTTWS